MFLNQCEITTNSLSELITHYQVGLRQLGYCAKGEPLETQVSNILQTNVSNIVAFVLYKEFSPYKEQTGKGTTEKKAIRKTSTKKQNETYKKIKYRYKYGENLFLNGNQEEQL